METPTLSSERFQYRPITLDDMDFIYELFRRPETNKYSEYPDLTSREEAVEMYNAFMKPDLETSFRVMIETLSGEPIGIIGLYTFSEDHKRAEIGYDLMKEHWGKGYMTETVQTILKYGFETLDLVRIEATVDPENIPSIKILEKHGFQLEGTLKKRFYHDNKWHDEMWYGLVKDS